MLRKRWILGILFSFLLSACGTANLDTVLEVPNTTTENMVTTVRLNTAQCSEPDDWYLDGYRVGKSFRYQKEAMYQQRVNYCRNTLSHTHQDQQQWENGFKYGIKKA